MNQWLRRISVFALLFNAATLGMHYYALYKSTERSALPVGSILQPVIGLDAQGVLVNEDVTRSCHIVRYTSVHCPWCRKDEHSWREFQQALHRDGCDSTILAPGASDMPVNAAPIPNQHMISLVPVSVADQLNLIATPTTIVLDRAWKVKWSAIGVLQPADTEKALSSLR